mgnify:CR=1 FL=1
MSKSRKRRIKAMTAKLKYLNGYIAEASETFEEYNALFKQDYTEILKMISGEKKDRNGPPSDEDETPSRSVAPSDLQDPPPPQVEEEVEPSPETPAWAKKLYRSIALTTHPDKLTAKDDVEEKTRLFNAAARSLKKGELDKLIDVALELELPIDLPDTEMARIISGKIASAEKEIRVFESCVAWHWCETDDPIVKSRILKQALSSQGRDVPEDGMLLDLVKRLDEV